MQIFKEICFYVIVSIISWEVCKGNVAMAILAAAILLVDYHMWVRGSKSLVFTDKTQIEKDLREIQKLEMKQKLKDLSDTK